MTNLLMVMDCEGQMTDRLEEIKRGHYFALEIKEGEMPCYDGCIICWIIAEVKRLRQENIQLKMTANVLLRRISADARK